MSRLAIKGSPEFRRIKGLPRVRWTADDIAGMIRDMTELLKTDNGTMTLLPVQAVMLCESLLADGLLSGAGVGHGKTLVSLLIPTLMQAERPLLLVPAGCIDKTHYEMQGYSKHFKIFKTMKIMSYYALSQVKNSGFLNEYRPDVIVSDECHKLKSFKAARTKKFIRFMVSHPETKFFAMSGTITRKSIRDYWHLMGLALKESSPLPAGKNEMEKWAEALDSDTDDWSRPMPGVLLSLSGPEDEGSDLDKARAGYQQRLTDTVGVVMTEASSIDIPLKIRAIRLDLPITMHPLMDKLHKEWITPSGEELSESFQIWDIDRQLAQGFYYKWKYPPPAIWMETRKKWYKYIQVQLNKNLPWMDSPRQVEAASDNVQALIKWREVRGMYRIITIPVYVDDFLIDEAVKWIEMNKGMVWTLHTAMGERIAQKANVPYFGAGKAASKDILTHRGACVASINAHGMGKNLQRYSRALVVMPPSSGDVWEQLLGRLHRQGQQEEEVVFDFIYTTPNALEYMQKAHRRATYMEQTAKQKQKIRHSEHIGFSIK